MISEKIIREKISLLNIEHTKFSSNDIKHIIENREEFSRSLFLLSNLDETDVYSLNEIDKLIVLFKEVVGLELLIRFHEKGFIRDQFTNRITLLLATRNEQLEIIRNHLDVLYRVRNEVAHTLSINKGEEFEIYFKNKIEEAISFANSYHKLLLLRLFYTETEVIDKTSLNLKLKKFGKISVINENKPLDVPLPEYHLILCKELSSLTGIESSYSKQAFRLKLPDEKKKYYLGLNSHGGLITQVHESVDMYECFYEDKENFSGDSRIIPSTEVWEDFTILIKEKLKNIMIKEPEKLKIISKTHKSVLFFTGYYFSKAKKTVITSDIDGKELDLEPLKNNVDFEQYWTIKVQNLNNTDSEAVLILNITGYIDQIVIKEYERLRISNLPKIICNMKFDNFDLSPTNQELYNIEFIHKACKALELYLNNSTKTRSLRKIHLFVKTRGIITLLLGMHFGSLGYTVVHYEYGRNNTKQENEKYYRVFSSFK